MNIHINKLKYEQLLEAPKVGTFVIGSPLYGLNDENSDRDYLTIYYPFKNQINNPFFNHHQYQYKDIENNVDHNFVDIVTFIKNLVSGDSLINFELLHSDAQIYGSDIDFLVPLKKHFYTYNVCKSYLGFAKRDCTTLHKRKTDPDRNRGILHIERCYISALQILTGEFKLRFKDVILSTDTVIKNFDHQVTMNRIDHIRKIMLNPSLENGKITRFLNPDVQHIVNTELMNLINNKFNINNEILNLNDIYESNENPELKYETQN